MMTRSGAGRGGRMSGEWALKTMSVKQDNNCAFGKWLHCRIDASEKNSAHYAKVVSLHAEFHKVAGHILDVASNGEKDQANNLISADSQFSNLSTQLTQEMQTWKGSL